MKHLTKLLALSIIFTISCNVVDAPEQKSNPKIQKEMAKRSNEAALTDELAKGGTINKQTYATIAGVEYKICSINAGGGDYYAAVEVVYPDETAKYVNFSKEFFEPFTSSSDAFLHARISLMIMLKGDVLE